MGHPSAGGKLMPNHHVFMFSASQRRPTSAVLLHPLHKLTGRENKNRWQEVKPPYSITPNENYQTHSCEEAGPSTRVRTFCLLHSTSPSVYIHEIKYSLISNICGVNVSEGTTGGCEEMWSSVELSTEDFLTAKSMGSRHITRLHSLIPLLYLHGSRPRANAPLSYSGLTLWVPSLTPNPKASPGFSPLLTLLFSTLTGHLICSELPLLSVHSHAGWSFRSS